MLKTSSVRIAQEEGDNAPDACCSWGVQPGNQLTASRISTPELPEEDRCRIREAEPQTRRTAVCVGWSGTNTSAPGALAPLLRQYALGRVCGSVCVERGCASEFAARRVRREGRDMYNMSRGRGGRMARSRRLHAEATLTPKALMLYGRLASWFQRHCSGGGEFYFLRYGPRCEFVPEVTGNARGRCIRVVLQSSRRLTPDQTVEKLESLLHSVLEVMKRRRRARRAA